MSEGHIDHLHVSCHYDVPPESVFDAWVQPELARQWLYTGEHSEILQINMDLRVGGSFSITEQEKETGAQTDHFGKYLEIERPLQLVFTVNVPQQFPGESTVTLHFFPTLNGCELKLSQVGVAKELTEASWNEMLHRLKLLLTEASET